MDLIQGDQPLPDDAFNASSVLSPFFAPSNARFNNRPSETSGKMSDIFKSYKIVLKYPIVRWKLGAEVFQ